MIGVPKYFSVSLDLTIPFQECFVVHRLGPVARVHIPAFHQAYIVLEANAKVNGKGHISHLHPPPNTP